jgi:site-specific DNA-cytosine methylase
MRGKSRGGGDDLPLIVGGLRRSYGKGTDSDATDAMVAVHMLQDPISDTEITPAWGKGTKTGTASIAVGPIPISGDALRGEGTAMTPSPDAEGRVRLRDPGFAVGEEGDPAFTLSAASPGAVMATGVRRLTPTECERLQALPDGWTDLGGTPDSRRYAALGDAVTASVAEWIGRRLL